MSNLHVYTADEAREAGLAYPDFYFSDGYGVASEASDKAAWRIAVWDEGPIYYPFLLRSIEGQDGLFDITAPYGYPGIWSPEETPLSAWKDFRQACRAYFVEQGVVAEFLRLSGLVPGRASLLEADSTIQAQEHNSTLAMKTGDGYEVCWDRFESRARTKVRKARKNGVHGRWLRADASHVAPGSTFRTLYDQTMERIEATPYYFFPDAYYEAMATRLELHILEILSAEDEVIASAMVLPCGSICHLHLVGTAEGANRLGVSNFLYDATCEWAAERGYAYLHIGGGLKPEDSLFYFKKGFGGETVPFWIGRSILQPEMYAELTQKRAETFGLPAQDLIDSGFFPAYRASPPPPPAPADESPEADASS